MAIGQVKAFSTYEMEKVLIRNGYELARHNGSDHRIWKKDGRMIVLTKNLSKMVARRLIKENNLVL